MLGVLDLFDEVSAASDAGDANSFVLISQHTLSIRLVQRRRQRLVRFSRHEGGKCALVHVQLVARPKDPFY